MSPSETSAPVTLDDKYAAPDGRVLISGVQALVRLTLEQRRLDRARGLDTRAFVSGYQGSPLGGVDLEMGRAARFLDDMGVVFKPGLNEELAATAVAGTQLLDQVPGRRHEGVTGFWYGKNPGLDRAADAIRHANTAGTAPLGGAVAWIGDDPGCKSSTLPSSCEPMCQSLAMPLLAPGSVAEIIEFGLHAVALSRATGLWAGLKIVADIADASATVDLAPLREHIPAPDRAARASSPILLGAAALDAEHDLLTRRLDLARAYARTHRLNRVMSGEGNTALGIVASGTTYAVVLRALADLGLDRPALDDAGLRLIRLAMPFPLDHAELAAMTCDLDRVLVVEDKVPFLEGQLKQALYGRDRVPAVLGRELLTARGTLGAEDVAKALLACLDPDRLPRPAVTLGPDQAGGAPKKSRPLLPLVAARTPYFCSGCPHNTSTRTSDGTLVGVGIGCHAMIALDGHGRGTQVGITQMGGEGAQWIGLTPFTEDRHFVQNLGDGTFHHSGSLAIRAAVAAGVTMTYKLLYNDAVAMTGGQRAEGRLDVPTLTRELELEGVRRVVVTTPEPETYRGVSLAPIASVRHRDDLPEVEKELAALDGVTVLIHDDRCAAEERRLRKRGKLPTPTEKVVINERVCEGCGDCGDVSTCLSVQPVETEYGRKTRIHQASCNTDLSCLKGDCPSFLLVEPGTKRPRQAPPLPAEPPEPAVRVGDDALIRMPGIGGTGVVTVSQILQMAAHLDGLHTAGLEQTGLAQKGGPVVSDVRISPRPLVGSVRATHRTADVLIGFDLLGAAADANLAVSAPERTIAVLNTSVVPTAAMVTGRAPVPGHAGAVARVVPAVKAVECVAAHELADVLFGDHMPANLLLLGAAYQLGCLPVSAASIERAITLNRASVEQNLAAFRWGRTAVSDPAAVRAIMAPPPVPEGFDEVVAARAADLTGYQNATYARTYTEDVRRVRAAAVERAGERAGAEIALAYARGLHKLMAYKDEYEVARLHLDPAEQERREREFGADATVSVLLHPPVFRAMGMKRKLRLRRSAPVLFRGLRAARVLRGTALDLFGQAKVRRVERELVTEYRDLVRAALTRLTPGTAAAVTEIAGLPDLIRGYEDIKLARVAEFRERARTALARLDEPAPSTQE
ncbi:indolepyruvate ferredoxin oxidoreductase family protein [Nonomuraea sp. KC401]|uniref:indolepyruvate ferredoxin oxidoreductase family protein n=1 Tax=unclassified Nonomuraea TaxID=2593643 RepID=UPI0010FDBFAA|nr:MULTISPECIES: indolepyruvate ferredoxin oxidoreductase family protein [unclassified Nonomuraea]NBE99790.1 indolepyruvate ferredoxin oxidoreductase family protein [Nonomuraea sp. K271]TLF55640.1 indolepyruvate ferredoxin oxidoreductase family protein [Nonomuraea sp. KC401]